MIDIKITSTGLQIYDSETGELFYTDGAEKVRNVTITDASGREHVWNFPLVSPEGDPSGDTEWDTPGEIPFSD